MITSIFVSLLLGLTTATPLDEYPVKESSKRGLLHMINPENLPGLNVSADKPIWERSGSDISWYYNYESFITLDKNMTFEYVPMAWGNQSLDNLKANLVSLQENGTNFQHVLFYNEPDRNFSDGGSGYVYPKDAVASWKQYMEPIRTKYNVKIGAPATSGSPGGFQWITEFMNACTGCNVDFVPFHWYGDAEDLVTYVAGFRAANITQPLWLTEYAPPWRPTKEETQDLFKNVTNFLDSSEDIERYSYWGAWRTNSTPPRFGKNMSLLTDDGKLTQIGGWYMHEALESGGYRMGFLSWCWIGVAACSLWTFL